MSIHAKPNPEVEVRLAAQRRNSSIASAIIALLVIVIVGLVLGFFLLPNMIKETPVIVTYQTNATPETDPVPEKVKTAVQRKPSAPSSSMVKVIASASVSDISIPVPDVVVDVQALDFGDGDDFGSGWGDEGTGTGGSGSLFGRKISSKSLGVVLDISGSAHAHLDKAIAEIDENFPTAHIVFVVGCGMSDGKAAFAGGGGKVPGKPRVVPYKDLDSEKKYNSLQRSVPGQLNLFFGKIGQKRGDELRKHFDKRDNLYALYGGDIMATNFAFDFLLDIKVDTIYWFADFADGIKENTIEDLTKDLKKSSVTVISHNFLGKPVGKLATEMTQKTGGQTIELIPGSK